MQLDPVYKTSPEKRRYLEKLARTMPGNAGFTQCQRLLVALRKYPLSTAECQRYLDVFDPPARIHTMRHRDGHDIETCWWRGETEQGVVHKVGLYTLMREARPAKPAKTRKAKGGAK